MTFELIHVLYVDDEEVNLFLFKNLFKDRFQISTAMSPKQGMEIIKENKNIKVVITDMNMPDMDGLQFIDKVKADHQEIHFIILTGYEINQRIKDALRNGIIKKYLPKPFNVNVIADTVSNVIKNPS